METCLSTKGQLVLPSSVRRQLGIRSGDAFDVVADPVEGRIVLTLKRRRPSLVISTDSVGGFPFLTVDPDSGSDSTSILTHREVEEILSDFP